MFRPDERLEWMINSSILATIQCINTDAVGRRWMLINFEGLKGEVHCSNYTP